MKANRNRPISSIAAGSFVGTKQLQGVVPIAQRVSMYMAKQAAYQSKFARNYTNNYPYIYTPYGQREFRVFTGGGGTSAGAGAGDVWRPQSLISPPKKEDLKRKPWLEEEYVQELIKSYQVGWASRNEVRRLVSSLLHYRNQYYNAYRRIYMAKIMTKLMRILLVGGTRVPPRGRGFREPLGGKYEDEHYYPPYNPRYHTYWRPVKYRRFPDFDIDLNSDIRYTGSNVPFEISYKETPFRKKRRKNRKASYRYYPRQKSYGYGPPHRRRY